MTTEEPATRAASRESIIQAVRTPLGFFTLLVLASEAILSGAALKLSGGDRTLTIAAALGLLFVLALIVAVTSWIRPEALKGRRAATRIDRPRSKTATTPALHIGGFEDVISWGWSGEDLLGELIRLDYETIEGLTRDDEGMPKEWSAVFMDHPDTWKLLIEEPHMIVGYWHCIPLVADAYGKVKSGELRDGGIRTEHVPVFELLNGWYDFYFVSICIRPAYRRSLRTLVGSVLDAMTKFAMEGVFVRELCANAYTPSGTALCESFRMSPVAVLEPHGRTYVISSTDLLKNELVAKRPQLTALYREAPEGP